MSRIKRFVTALLRVEYICHLVFALRFFYYVRIRRRVREYADDRAVRAGKYSVDLLLEGRTSNRPLQLIRPLSVIQAVQKDGFTLSVGSRFETELLYLVAYGFQAKSIRGLDMVSYSPWIDIGNMHKMPYADASCDTIILGWVLPYSDSPDVAAREVVRVAKPGAVVAIGLSSYPERKIKEMLASGSYAVRPDLRKQTVAELLELFGNHVDRVYYSHEPASKDQEGTCAVIFSIKKPG